jgi:hypothetical protein
VSVHGGADQWLSEVAKRLGFEAEVSDATASLLSYQTFQSVALYRGRI